MTLAQRLIEIEAAITSVLAGGQEVQIGKRKIVRPELSTLEKMRADTLAEIIEENNTSYGDNTSVCRFVGF